MGCFDLDVEEAQRGIIYIDETDKIARRAKTLLLLTDVSGRSTAKRCEMLEEQSLMFLLKGGVKHPYQDCIQIDTAIFICSVVLCWSRKGS